MPHILIPVRKEAARIAVLASAAVGAVLATRYLGTRKVNCAERLADALLHTEPLRNAAALEDSEARLAACADYFLNVAYYAAQGLTGPGVADDPPGYNRTHAHRYARASASVLTEQNVPDLALTFAVSIEEIGEARGTHRVGGLRLSGLTPARPAPDTVQITLTDGYIAQIETEFEVGDYLVTGRTRVFGAATVRDNQGNVGRIHVTYDGSVTGAMTRDTRVIGRFEGHVGRGVQFRRYQIEQAA